MFCPKCGKNQPEESLFCYNCGHNLKTITDAVKRDRRYRKKGRSVGRQN